MSFLEVLPAFLLIIGLLSYYRTNGYYAEETPAASAPLCACNGTCVVPEVPRTSDDGTPACPATPARLAPFAAIKASPVPAARPPPNLSWASPAAASPAATSPAPRTPRVWRNTCSTDKESVDNLLRWMSQRFLEGVEGDDDEDL